MRTANGIFLQIEELSKKEGYDGWRIPLLEVLKLLLLLPLALSQYAGTSINLAEELEMFHLPRLKEELLFSLNIS